MYELAAGVRRFQDAVFPTKRAFFEQLASGQSPQALMITCSDSRIVPSLITQCEPGDLFLVRNVGNIVPPYNANGECATAAAIEFALTVLEVPSIIICGHSDCGAMKAVAHDKVPEGLPNLGRWLGYASTPKRIVAEVYRDLTPEQKLNVCIQENVLAQLDNLKTHPVVASRLCQGQVTLYGWVYKIETGDVFAYDSQQGQFLPFASGVPPASTMLRVPIAV